MDPLRVIAEQKGVFLTQEALAFGYDDKAITRAVRGRLWHRVRRGAYVPFDVWAGADEERRHLIRAAAVHRSYGDAVAFSHTTACLIRKVKVWGVDLSRVHVTRLDGAKGRAEPDVVHHEGYIGLGDEVDRVDGWLTVPVARASLQLGLVNGSTETALVALDSVLHQELASADEIANVYDLIQHWPGTRHLHVALRMADAGGQSVGESRARWMFRCQDVPAPELQCKVYDEHGELLGITDFGWRHRRMLGEFDGLVKYGRLLKPGQHPGDAVFEEKVREDAIRRATGAGMARFIWVDLNRPKFTCDRLKWQLDTAA